MSKKIQLSIAEPCHENWENMSPVDKGKFCGSCQKQVVDFSMMSDRQVAQFFKKPSTGSVCGRFMTDQLEREIEIPKKRIPWVKYFFTIALPALFISKASAQNIKMGKMIAKPVTKDTVRIPKLITVGLVAPKIYDKPVCSDTTDVVIKGEIAIVETKPVTGKVVDEKGEPVAYASVMIKGTKTGVVTKGDGTFSILPASNWGKIVLVVSSIGFELNETMVDKSKYQANKEINIVIIGIKNELMGEVVVVGMVARKPVKSVKKTNPILVIPDVIKDADSKSFKIYPNPVVSGASLNIEWKQTEEGYYTLELLNQSGQAAHRQEIWIDAEARLLSIDVPFVSAGSYFLVLINKKTGKKFSEKIIIQ